MGCDKTSNICIDTVYDKCVVSEVELPENTTIEDTCDVSQEDINKDLYALIADIIPDLSEEDFTCIGIEEDEEDIKILDVIEKLVEKVCELNTKLEELNPDTEEGSDPLENIDVSTLNIPSCVSDPCGDDLTLKSLLQYFLDKETC